MNRPIATIGMALLGLVIGSSAAESTLSDRPSDIYLWPVLTVDKGDAGTDVRYLIPLGQYTAKGGRKIKAFRPLFIHKFADDGSRSLDIVWPVAKFARDRQENVSRRVFPLFWRAGVEGERRLTVFPVLWTWWHEEKSEEKTKGVILGPVWNVRQYADGADWSRGVAPWCWAWRENESTGFWFAPVFWGRKDASEDKAFGVLPAYIDWRRGRKQGRWILPVYWQRDGEDLESLVVAPFFWWIEKGRYQVFFPVYGRVRGRDSEWINALGLVYMRQTEDDFRKHHVLWPLLTWGGDGQDQVEFALWPLYGMKHRQGENEKARAWRTKRNFALWPLFHWGSSEQFRENSTTTAHKHFNVFPLYWTGTSETRRPSEAGETIEGMETNKYNWLLPFYTYDEKKSGRRFTMLWPVWRNALSEEQRQYSILWRVFDARFQPNGDRQVSVLWRGYRDEKKSGQHSLDMFPFLSYRRNDAGNRRFRFLGGLFEWSSVSGQRHLRLFYLPKLSLGGSSPKAGGAAPVKR